VITEIHEPRAVAAATTRPGTEFHIGRIDMVANTGTYLDSPFHRHARRRDLARCRSRALAELEGVVVGQTMLAGERGARSTPAPSRRSRCAARRCWSSTGWDRTGAASATSAATRS
jgi:kynurenine formamidase